MSDVHDNADGVGRGQESADQATDSHGSVVCPRCGSAIRLAKGGLWPVWLPDPLEEPTVPVWPVVGRLLGRRRSAILELARRDRLPVRVLRVGRSYRVATAELARMLGLDDTRKGLREELHDQ